MQRINGKQIRYTLIEVKAMFFLERRHEYKTTVGPVTTLHKHRETRKTRYSKGVIGNMAILQLVLKARATSNSIALWPKASQDPWDKSTKKWLQIASDVLLSFAESTSQN